MTDEQMMEVAVLENLQREDLTPLEEAQAYQTLMDKLSLTQAQVANRLGKSRPYIANYLRLLGLPPLIKEALNEGRLSMGQARTILGLKDKKQLVGLAKRAMDKNLTVRQLEEIVAQMNGTSKKKAQKKGQRKPVYLREAEAQLQSKFGAKVAVSQSRKRGAGKIEIPYTSNDDLTRILEVLNISFWLFRSKMMIFPKLLILSHLHLCLLIRCSMYLFSIINILCVCGCFFSSCLLLPQLPILLKFNLKLWISGIHLL